jgi:glucosylceramidase
MEKKRFNRIIRQAITPIVLGSAGLFTMVINIQCQQPKDLNISVYSSSLDGDRLTKKPNIGFESPSSSAAAVITVDEGKQFQKIDGFGATFNEAGMICLNSLKPEDKEGVLKKLFDPESGAGFTLMKSPIAACDFASGGGWYTYDDTPGDTAMTHFSIERDLGPTGLITFIKAASKYGKFEIQSPMDFAPDWMYFAIKPGQKHIKPEYYPALAKYYRKYLHAYSENGVNIKYLDLFNEADNKWYSNVTYKVMGELIKKYVGPQLEASGLKTRVQFGETPFRSEGVRKFPEFLSDPEIKKYVSSMAVHGYDTIKHYEDCTELHNKFPDLPIWMTEVCWVKVPIHEFSDGEYWGNMIMNDMKNWVSGWIYWNMILDNGGGPWLTSVKHGDPDNNRQHPVVIINRDTKEVTYTGLFYYLEHFSKFVRPGAYRINTTGGWDQLNFAAFKNTDGSIVLNIINNGSETDCKVAVEDKVADQKLKAHSITTLQWNEVKSKQ